MREYRRHWETRGIDDCLFYGSIPMFPPIRVLSSTVSISLIVRVDIRIDIFRSEGALDETEEGSSPPSHVVLLPCNRMVWAAVDTGGDSAEYL